MAPKDYPYYHKVAELRYRLSSDGREYVFEDGQRMAVPSPPGRRSHADTVTDQSTQPESSSAAEQRVIVDATKALSLQGSDTKNWSGEDPRTGLLTQWEFGPTQQAPATREQPSRSYNAKLIRSNGAASYEESASGTPATGPSRRGFKDYKRSNNPAQDFAQFRVVEILIIPPPTSAVSVITGGPPPSGPSDVYIPRMRRFVIIGQGNRQDFLTFKALPIKTYNGEGVGAPNVVKAHHTIIHTTKDPPKPMDSELPQKQSNGVVESPMRARSIRVKSYDRETMLDPISRLDFFDLHEFDYNPFFKVFGTVHHDSRPHLLPLYNAVRAALKLTTHHSAGPSPHVVTSPAVARSPAPAPATGASQGSSDLGREKVIERITQVRQLAVSHKMKPPTVNAEQLDRFAQDSDEFRRWMLAVRTRMDAALAQRNEEAQEDEDENDSDSDSDDNEDDNKNKK